MSTKIVIDRNSHDILVNNKSVKPTKQIFEMFYFLALNKNMFITRDRLLNTIWETEYYSDRAVDTAISRLQKKLLDVGVAKGEIIESKISVGYRVKTTPKYSIEIIDDSSSFEQEKEEKGKRDSNNKRINRTGILIPHNYKGADGIVNTIALADCSEYGEMVIYTKNGKWHAKPVQKFKSEFSS